MTVAAYSVIAYGTFSASNIYATEVTMNGSLSVANTMITFMSGEQGRIEIGNGFFSFFNVTLRNLTQIFCQTDSPQYITQENLELLRESDGSKCNFITDLDRNASEDNVSLSVIDQLTTIISDVRDNYAEECVNNSGYNYLFEIGHPLYGDTDILNTDYYDPICCFGYRSCKLADSLVTTKGNIYCLADEACSDIGLIWTGTDVNDEEEEEDSAPSSSPPSPTDDEDDEDDENDEDENRDGANIYCMGEQSCSDATMQSGSSILCSAQYSCENSFVLEAETVYCTMNACVNSLIRKAKNVYLIDFQSLAIVYSGYVGTMNVYLRGNNAGRDVEIYCLSGDVCNIDCGYESCNNQSTVLYCDGKCNVICDSIDPQECLNIKPTPEPTSAPSMSPTEVPTASPTDLPTTSPTTHKLQLLTEEQLSQYFNWVLGLFFFSFYLHFKRRKLVGF